MLSLQLFIIATFPHQNTVQNMIFYPTDPLIIFIITPISSPVILSAVYQSSSDSPLKLVSDSLRPGLQLHRYPVIFPFHQTIAKVHKAW